MKVVIFGVSGNLGTSLATALDREPAVTAVVGVSRRASKLKLAKLTHVRADITRDELKSHCHGAAAVVHLAWMIRPERDPGLLERVNVEGSSRVFQAAVDAGVPALLYSSSVGAYAPGPKQGAVDESYDTSGIEGALYSQQKAKVERLLDGVAAAYPALRVVRMRPALVFKRDAGAEIRRYFTGPFVPSWFFAREHVPFVPNLSGLRFQCVHSLDVAEAFRLALFSHGSGAYNLAADPVLDPDVLAHVLGARKLPVPAPLARAFVSFAFRAHLTPTSPSWLDLALNAPIMDCGRAHAELGWKPRWSATDALLELLDGMRRGSGLQTAPMRPMGTPEARV